MEMHATAWISPSFKEGIHKVARATQHHYIPLKSMTKSVVTLDTTQSIELWPTFLCNNMSNQGSLLT